ncbi:MAG: hypothetical protein QOJ76_1989, partial [Acidobacteriota bacterium]|nr:hypothetical protein [Acidobacteriota bacterium]
MLSRRAFFFAGCGLFIVLSAPTAAAQRPTLVSIQNNGSGGGNSDSENASISANGRFVTFDSFASNLTPADTNSAADIFVRDLQTGATALVSVNQAGTASGNGSSINPVVSADGRFIAFESRASDLVANDTNGRSDVFVRDMQTGVTTMLSLNVAGTNGGNGDSTRAVISADGSVVSYESAAPDLVADDNNLSDDVFARDLVNGITRLVSVNSAGTGSGNNRSFRTGRGLSDAFFRRAISADGRVVVFESDATNLTALPDTNGKPDVFARDLGNATTRLVSVNRSGTASGNRESYHPTISANGQVVVFESRASDLVPNDTNDVQDLLARNLQTNVTMAVNINRFGNISNTAASAENGDLSADGRFVAFQSAANDLVANDTNKNSFPIRFTDVFVRDLQAGTTTLVSINSAGTDSGDDVAFQPAISGDGRYVAFLSMSRDLDADISKPVDSGDIYVRDMQTGRTRMVSVSRTGDAGSNGDTRFPSISADGRFVAFESTGDNLVASDANDRRDIFATAVNGQVRFSSGAYVVGESGGAATITLTRNAAGSGPVIVSYGTHGGSAASGSDYIPQSGTLTFADGETSKTFTVPVNDDGTDEADETINLFLSDGTGTPGSLSTAVLSVTDDDPPPSLSIGDATFVESDAGSFDALFTVSLSAPSEQTIKVDLKATGGTANNFDDFAFNPTTLIISPGEAVKTFPVRIIGDTLFEDDESFTIDLSNPSNATIADAQATGVIRNDDPLPAVFIDDVAVTEGNVGGSRAASFVVKLSNPSSRQVSVRYATADADAVAGSDYTATSGTLTFFPGQLVAGVSVPITGDTLNEASESFFLNLSNPINAVIADGKGLAIIDNDDSPALLQFDSATYSAAEDGPGLANITVVRSGDTTGEATVDYSTFNLDASDRSDYTLTTGTLRFGVGELSKTFTVFITNDVYVESTEAVLLVLSNPNGTNRASLGARSEARLMINSDDAVAPTPSNNPADTPEFFVRQHYRDFLNRDPDAPGLAFWKEGITSCGADVQCREVKRVNVSAAFFLSIEFQNTGDLVYRLHQAAFNSGPLLRLNNFLSDTQEIGRGVVVGEGDWQGRLEANKQAFVNAFVGRTRFMAAYPSSMTPAQFVDALNAATGGALTQAERDALVADLSASRKTRADILRAVAENETFNKREFNRAFVYMQYVGYLRRGP